MGFLFYSNLFNNHPNNLFRFLWLNNKEYCLVLFLFNSTLSLLVQLQIFKKI